MKIIILIIMTSLLFMQTKYKNLQILDIHSEQEMRKYMKSISKDLGVRCNFCHDLNDKSIDTDLKNISRMMIKMQQELNKNYFSANIDSNKSSIKKITCWTCHRGSHIPEYNRSQ